MRICITPDCGRPVLAKGACLKCYHRLPAQRDKDLRYRNSEAGKARRHAYVQSAKYKAYCVTLSRRPKVRFRTLISKCKRLKLPCTVTAEQHAALLGKPCFYCAGPLANTGCGLDQIVPGDGYTPENVVPCCYDCNFLKGDHLTLDETLAIVAVIRTLRGGKVWS